MLLTDTYTYCLHTMGMAHFIIHLKSPTLHFTNLIPSYPVKILDQIHMKGHDLIRKILGSVLDNTQSVGFKVSGPIVCRLQ